jgi:transcriptional regulator with XRE-family HTH domain
MLKIGSKLKEIRLKNKFSIPTVIKKLEEVNIYITKKTIYRWENDSIIPTLETIKVLSYIYNTNLNEIYEDKKFYKVLSENEYMFINTLRENNNFKKIVKTLVKM